MLMKIKYIKVYGMQPKRCLEKQFQTITVQKEILNQLYKIATS